MIAHFKHGDPVWVKMSRFPWWPALVVASSDCPLETSSYKMPVACVQFIVENSYKIIYDLHKIHQWESDWNRHTVQKSLGRLEKVPETKLLFVKGLLAVENHCGVSSSLLPVDGVSQVTGLMPPLCTPPKEEVCGPPPRELHAASSSLSHLLETKDGLFSDPHSERVAKPARTLAEQGPKSPQTMRTVGCMDTSSTSVVKRTPTKRSGGTVGCMDTSSTSVVKRTPTKRSGGTVGCMDTSSTSVVKRTPTKRSGGTVGCMDTSSTSVVKRTPTKRSGGTVGCMDTSSTSVVKRTPTKRSGGTVGCMDTSSTSVVKRTPTKRSGGTVGCMDMTASSTSAVKRTPTKRSDRTVGCMDTTASSTSAVKRTPTKRSDTTVGCMDTSSTSVVKRTPKRTPNKKGCAASKVGSAEKQKVGSMLKQSREDMLYPKSEQEATNITTEVSELVLTDILLPDLDSERITKPAGTLTEQGPKSPQTMRTVGCTDTAAWSSPPKKTPSKRTPKKKRCAASKVGSVEKQKVGSMLKPLLFGSQEDVVYRESDPEDTVSALTTLKPTSGTPTQQAPGVSLAVTDISSQSTVNGDSRRKPRDKSKGKSSAKRARAKSLDVKRKRTKLYGYSSTLEDTTTSAMLCHTDAGMETDKYGFERVLQPAMPRGLVKAVSLPFDPNIDKDACDTDDHHGDDECGSDTDDDLPDVFSNRSKVPLEKGDLFWVKTRGFPFWPAVVKVVYKRRKTLQKITVVFIGEIPEGPKSVRLSYNKKRMFPFHHMDLATMKDEGMKSRHAEYFQEAVDRAEDYVLKKCLGKADDPFTFFAEDFAQGEETFTWSDEELDALMSSLGETPGTASENPAEGDIEETSEWMEEDTIPETKMSSKLKKTIERRTERGRRLVDLAKNQELKNYLVSIYNGSRPCRRHTQYHKATTIKELHRMRHQGFGPIDDEDQHDELVSILKAYLIEVTKDPLPSLGYLLDVWVPEAIIWSLAKLGKTSYETAEDRFENGTRRNKEERAIQQEEIIRTAKNIAPEDDQKYREKIVATARSFLLASSS